jgi:hypothetical protein
MPMQYSNEELEKLLDDTELDLIERIETWAGDTPGKGRFERKSALDIQTGLPRLKRELSERTGLRQDKFVAKLGVAKPSTVGRTVVPNRRQ